jgi:DNA-directed RNA polymerase subunit L
MELKVVESKPDRMSIQVVGETHTLLNLLTEYAWEAKAKQATYIIDHPYLSNPELMVKSSDPKKTLSDAAQIIIDRTKEFRTIFDRAVKK